MTNRPNKEIPVRNLGAVHLRLERKSRGWTLRQAAEKTGLTPSMLGHLEAGRKLPSLESSIRIQDHFNIEPRKWLEEIAT